MRCPISFFRKPEFDDYPITTQTVCTRLNGKFSLIELYQSLASIVDPNAISASNQILQIVNKTIEQLGGKNEKIQETVELKALNDTVFAQTLNINMFNIINEENCKNYKFILKQTRENINAIINAYVPCKNFIRYIQYKTLVVGLMPPKKYKIKIRRRVKLQQNVVKIENTKRKPKKSNEAFMNQVTVSICIDDCYINVKIFPDGNLVFTGCRKDNHASLALQLIIKSLNNIGYNVGDEPTIPLKVSMTNKIIKMGFPINREMLDTLINMDEDSGFMSNYDPCEKSSVSVTYNGTNTFTVFLKGTIIHSGKETEKMREPFNKFMNFICDHIEEIMLKNMIVEQIFDKHYNKSSNVIDVSA